MHYTQRSKDKHVSRFFVKIIQSSIQRARSLKYSKEKNKQSILYLVKYLYNMKAKEYFSMEMLTDFIINRPVLKCTYRVK